MNGKFSAGPEKNKFIKNSEKNILSAVGQPKMVILQSSRKWLWHSWQGDCCYLSKKHSTLDRSAIQPIEMLDVTQHKVKVTSCCIYYPRC